MEFEFVVEMKFVGTDESFPQLIRLAANARHLQSRPYNNRKLGRRDQSPASSELFLSFTRRSFPDAENQASHNLAVLGKEMFVVILQRCEYRGSLNTSRLRQFWWKLLRGLCRGRLARRDCWQSPDLRRFHLQARRARSKTLATLCPSPVC